MNSPQTIEYRGYLRGRNALAAKVRGQLHSAERELAAGGDPRVILERLFQDMRKTIS